MDINTLNIQSDILTSKLLCYYLIAEAGTLTVSMGEFFSRIKREKFGIEFLQHEKMDDENGQYPFHKDRNSD